jgi:hypothetical protein
MWSTVLDHSHLRALHAEAAWPHGGREAWAWIGKTLCGLRGHDLLLHFETNRVCLECSSCGHQTPGWQLNGREYL